MRVEHIAFNVSDPVAVAEWYGKHLGTRVLRQGGGPDFTTFIADESGNVIFEIYLNPPDAVPDYRNMDPLLFHIAWASDDLQATREKMIAAGCTVQADIRETPSGDQLLMMRDPWGLAIQFTKRRTPMLP